MFIVKKINFILIIFFSLNSPTFGNDLNLNISLEQAIKINDFTVNPFNDVKSFKTQKTYPHYEQAINDFKRHFGKPLSIKNDFMYYGAKAYQIQYDGLIFILFKPIDDKVYYIVRVEITSLNYNLKYNIQINGDKSLINENLGTCQNDICKYPGANGRDLIIYFVDNKISKIVIEARMK